MTATRKLGTLHLSLEIHSFVASFPNLVPGAFVLAIRHLHRREGSHCAMSYHTIPSEGLQVAHSYGGLELDSYSNLEAVHHPSTSTSRVSRNLDSSKNDYHIVTELAAPERSSGSRKCRLRRRWFWIAVMAVILVVVALAVGVTGAMLRRRVKKAHSQSSNGGSTATGSSADPSSSGNATRLSLAKTSQLGATSFNDTQGVLQYRLYYQDGNDTIRESSWNATGKKWFVSNRNVTQAKTGSPIAAAGTGKPDWNEVRRANPVSFGALESC